MKIKFKPKKKLQKIIFKVKKEKLHKIVNTDNLTKYVYLNGGRQQEQHVKNSVEISMHPVSLGGFCCEIIKAKEFKKRFNFLPPYSKWTKFKGKTDSAIWSNGKNKMYEKCEWYK